MLKNKLPPSWRPHARPPVIGAIFGAFMVLSPILMGGHLYLLFFSLGGLIIVGGGVITVAFMSFDGVEVNKALTAIRNLFKDTKPLAENLHTDMIAIINCAKLVMEKGMRNFETVINKVGIRDPYVKYGLTMAVSGYGPEDVRNMMTTAAEAAYERDHVPVDILQAMTSHAPAFGMVGTLVGMVAMLSSLNDDTTNVGSSLAVAFLSTLYGVLSARMIYIPAATKLKQEINQRRFRNYLILEGITMLVSKKTPMQMQDRLNSFLRPESYDYLHTAQVTAMPNSKRMSAA